MNEPNLMTSAMNRMTDMLIRTDEKLAEYGVTPYAIRKATVKEQREQFKNLTPGELRNLIETYGVDEVNNWLGRFMPGEK